MVPLVYSSGYNITAFGLERLHPFDGVKYRRIHDWLVRRGIRTPADFVAPQPCTQEDLLRVHTAEYLQTLKDRAMLARILEVGIVGFLPSAFTDWRVLGPMRLAAGGTLLACRLARAGGLAINIGGGFHHASPAHAHGFCVYADVPIALACLHHEKAFRSVLVVDTDVHQGDGTADTIRSWPWAHMLDFYEEAIFPWPKAEEECAVPLRSSMGGAEYLDLVHRHLPMALERFAPDLVVYNAGSDVLRTDPLASLVLEPPDLEERDRFVVTEVRRRDIPLAMVLSGGYGPQSWQAHARSIEALCITFDQANNHPSTPKAVGAEESAAP